MDAEQTNKTSEELEKMKTSELMDYLDNPDTEYDDGDWEEIQRRTTFDFMYDEIKDLKKNMEGMQRAIDKLKSHEHGEKSGRVVYQ